MSYKMTTDGRMYFLKARDFHLPANMIWRSEAPDVARSVALPIRNEWVLYLDGSKWAKARIE
jgi:hypothetical protein